jgi:hypothetical protein
MRAVIIVLLALIGASLAFVTPLQPQARMIQQSTFSSFAFSALKMSDDESTEVPKMNEDGTVYDDEVDPAPRKSALSDSMKARLIAEASTGLNSDQKQSNVLLYIILGVAVLVLLGGQGIFF